MTLTDRGHLISNSELRTLKRCRRKWYLQWYLCLELPTVPGDFIGPRSIGTLGHRALQAHYDPADRRPVLNALEEVLETEGARLQELADAPLFPQAWQQFVADSDLLRIVVSGYVDWLGETGADAGLEPVAAETYLELPLGHDPASNQPVTLIGKLDVRVRRESDGAVLFLDHKFKGQMGPLHLLPMDEQMLTYDLLQLGERADARADGAIYNILRTVKRSARAKPPFYHREEIRHNAAQLAGFHDRLLSEARDLLLLRWRVEQGQLTEVYPNPTNDCAWDCPFLAVCPMFDDGSRVQDALAGVYVAGNPLDHYLTEGPDDHAD